MSLVIPAYNEATSIGHVIRDFRPLVDEIVVMDYVSPDGTGAIARELGAIVHSQNQDGPAFSPEMMIEVLRMEGRLIEIPVNYYRRRGGVSKHSTNRWQSMRTGSPTLRVILEKRLNVR